MIEKKTEIEVFGVNYERFSLGRQLQRFVKEYDIKNSLRIASSWS